MRRYVPISIAILVWAWTGIFVKILKDAGFDPFTQNLYRYAAATVVLLVLARLKNPSGFRRARRSPWVFALTGLAMAGFQTLWVLGMYRVEPAFAGIIGNSDLLLIMLIALFFADERRLVCDVRFAAALLVGLAAVVAFIALAPRAAVERAGGRGSLLLGSGLVLAGSGVWVVFAYLTKWLVRGHGAMVLFSFSAVFATLFLLVVALIAQGAGAGGAGLGHIFHVSWPFLLLLVGSGILNVGVCQALFQHSVRLLGVTLTRGLELVIPLLTALFSYLVRGERLSGWQWACGLVLLICVGYLTVLGNRLAGGAAAAGPDVEPEPGG